MNKNIIYICLLTGLLAACSKSDDYKEKFISNGGEIIYVGKVDSLRIKSGNRRVLVNALISPDPKVTFCRIYWDNKADSVSVPIAHSGKGDTLNRILTGLQEGRHTFEVVTFDASGNRSVTVTASGAVYGERYEASLSNRPVLSGELLPSGNTSIVWGEFDLSSGARASVVSYTKTDGSTATVTSPVEQMTTTLPSYKSGSKYNYRTVYLPDSASIDTFYTAWQSMGVKFEITSQYVKNAGPDFKNSAGGNDRWRTPADWVTNADVRNANGIGGLDAGSWLPSVALSMEAGWGLPAVNNGKIYQTLTLPAGKYSLEVLTGDCSDAGEKYLVVAKGAGLADIAQIASGSLVYKSLVKNATNAVSFELTTAGEITIGAQAKLPDTGTFFKIFNVKLYSMP